MIKNKPNKFSRLSSADRLGRFGSLNKGFKQFLIKTIIFIALFMAFAVVIGTKLYQYGILSDWKIEIWGRVGYILLFSIAGFILLYRDRLLKLEKFRYKVKDFLLLVISFILLIGFYLFEINANKIPISTINILLVHILGVSTFVFLGLAVYGFEFIKEFIKKFKKELGYFIIFGIVTASLMNLVWSLWPYFSDLVLRMTAVLLKIIGADFRIIEPRTIIVGSFGAQIAEACSGIYSIFLFSALYLFIMFVDWKKINKKKAYLLFVPAVIGAFLVNVLRVFILFLVGAYVSKDVAMGMYHSYTGMIFFLLYFAVFWFLFYKWMKDEKSNFIPRDTLYKNSLYLMLSTFIMSVFGFVFWMINARLFTTEQVGLATTIISAASLITSIAGLGLGAGLIRYLPGSERKNEKINTCFTLIALFTIVVSVIFLLVIDFTSPKLHFIKENMLLAFIFIIFLVISSLGGLIDSIFIAYRNTKFVLLENSIYSVLKLVFPFLLVSLGAYGIFGSYMLAITSGAIVSFFVLIYRFNYKPKFAFYDSIIKKIGKYSFGNYLAGIISALPTLILPLIILNNIGAETSAYYYMAMTIASALFIIPNATSNSLFAEGSYDEKNLKHNIWKAIKLIALFMIPAIIITIFFGKYVLLLFGKQYSSEGYMFLNIMAINGIFVAINAVIASIIKIRKQIPALITRSTLSAILILGLSLLFMKQGYGLLGIGYAYLIGQIITAIMFTWVVWRK
ncbi:MAG: archaeosortase/exosortase family protein [Candidatus Nanoarchaeia archaeon]|nr:archaeosortase/exosortase family protein [Candidatus Nanoarchaeia archaeon]MDD5740543.1 archaeosortase/exosortase family protein [Candidatus Nanoarchaeia archaeon]